MGVQKINKYIKQIDGNSLSKGVVEGHLSDLSGHTIAIDAFSYIYKALYNNGEDNYLLYILSLIKKFNKFKIRPIFVFDGKPPKEKNGVLQARRAIKDKKKNKIQELESSIVKIKQNTNNKLETIENKNKNNDNDNEINDEKLIKETEKEILKLKKRCITIDKTHISSVKIAFDDLNIEYVHIKDQEADIVCSELVKKGFATAVLSNDMDLLAYNCPITIRELNLKTNSIIIYNLARIVKNLNLTNEQLTQLMIMLGCDYSGNSGNSISLGVSCDNLYTLIKKYNSVDDILNHIDKNNLSRHKLAIDKNNYKEQYSKSIKLFKSYVDINVNDIVNYKSKTKLLC